MFAAKKLNFPCTAKRV